MAGTVAAPPPQVRAGDGKAPTARIDEQAGRGVKGPPRGHANGASLRPPLAGQGSAPRPIGPRGAQCHVTERFHAGPGGRRRRAGARAVLGDRGQPAARQSCGARRAIPAPRRWRGTCRSACRTWPRWSLSRATTPSISWCRGRRRRWWRGWPMRWGWPASPAAAPRPRRRGWRAARASRRRCATLPPSRRRAWERFDDARRRARIRAPARRADRGQGRRAGRRQGRGGGRVGRRGRGGDRRLHGGPHAGRGRGRRW